MDSTGEIDPSPQDAGPDCVHVAPDELICPACRYSLRGLVRPQCPECGLEFAWADLVRCAPMAQLLPFEYRQGGVTAFCRTAARGLSIRRFWTGQTLAVSPQTGRLVLYALLCAGSCVLALLFRMGVEVLAETRTATFRQIVVFNDSPTVAVHLARAAIGRLGGFWSLLLLLVMPLLWPWLVFAGLLIPRRSMRLAGVRSAHVLRCVVYSHDVLLWVGLAWFASAFAPLVLIGSMYPNIVSGIHLFLLWFPALGLAAWRLRAAYRWFLRMPGATGILAAAYAVVGLLVANLMVIAILLL